MNTPLEMQPPRLAAGVVLQTKRIETKTSEIESVRKTAFGQSLPPLTAGDIAEILSHVPPRPPYPDWITIIAAVGSVLNEAEAAMVLRAWSAEESPGEYVRKLRSRCQRVGIGTLIQRAKAHGFDASAFVRRRTNHDGTHRSFGIVAPAEPIARTVSAIERLPSIPGETLSTWNEGLDYLKSHAEIAARVDAWRSWPRGTTAKLVENQLIAFVATTVGKRGLAFPVQSPERGELGKIQTRMVGYHVRHTPTVGKRAQWSFHPNWKKDGQSTPGLPFVIGARLASEARTIVVTEGQWDAATLAAAGGWLNGNASWPEHTILFATRGVNGWKSLLTYWQQFLPPSAKFVLCPDADAAGATWVSPGNFRDVLVEAGHRVRVIQSAIIGAKDINDLHRVSPITQGEVSAWLKEDNQ